MKRLKTAHLKTANQNPTNTKVAGTKADAERIWKQLEDDLAPRLGLRLVDRVVYSHLLRHSQLEGKREVRFSIVELARRAGISEPPVRDAVRRLIAYGVLRLVERSNAGHVVEVRLPQEVRGVSGAERELAQGSPTRPRLRLEQTDFFSDRKLRHAIHEREDGLCFYCRKRLTTAIMCLDHVIPRVRSGRNSYRNLVSCCTECNSQKGQRPAADFLRWLYREQRVSSWELRSRLRALQALAAGKLRPRLGV